MVVEGGQDEDVFDIGVDGDGIAKRPPLPRRLASDSSQRRLPRWALAVIALLVGWLIGTLVGSRGTSNADPVEAVTPLPAGVESPTEPTTAEPTLVELPPTSGASPTFDFEPPEAAPEATAGPLPLISRRSPIFDTPTFVAPLSEVEVASARARDLITITMMNAQLRGVAVPADITLIENGIWTKIEVDRQVSGAIDGTVGQAGRRMLVVDDTVVFMAFDSVMAIDISSRSAPTGLATAIYLLPGSSPGRVWAVTSSSQSVIDIDVRNKRAHGTYPLDGVGVPVASYDGGIVLVPADSELGPIALWSPARGLESIPAIYRDADFLGAAAGTLVFLRDGGLATYNAVTGWNWQTPIDLPENVQTQSLVSPDAQMLAIVSAGTVSELPSVRVVDIETGAEVDRFDAAFAWQLRWVSETEMLFLSAEDNRVQVMLRDTTLGATLPVTDLDAPNYWVAVAG